MASGALWVHKDVNARAVSLKLKVMAGIDQNISMNDFVDIMLEDAETRVNNLIEIGNRRKKEKAGA